LKVGNEGEKAEHGEGASSNHMPYRDSQTERSENTGGKERDRKKKKRREAAGWNFICHPLAGKLELITESTKGGEKKKLWGKNHTSPHPGEVKQGMHEIVFISAAS